MALNLRRINCGAISASILGIVGLLRKGEQMESAAFWKRLSIIATAVLMLTQAAWGDRVQINPPLPKSTSAKPISEEESLLELAKKHRAAIIDSSKIEGKLDDLEVIVHFYPDILHWNLLNALIEQLEEKIPAKKIDRALKKLRKELSQQATKPGFTFRLTQKAMKNKDRSKPVTLHLFPENPRGFLDFTLNTEQLRWSLLAPPEGMQRGRIKVAKFTTVRKGREVPLIKELEPKGARWIFESGESTLSGQLPQALNATLDSQLKTRIFEFDRYHGKLPQPALLDLNDPDSTFQRKREVELTRAWPPPWPPTPKLLERVFQGGSVRQEKADPDSSRQK